MDIHIPTPVDPQPRRRARLPQDAFAAASLLEWLEFASRAQVASVPASVVARLSIDALMEFDQGTERSMRALAALELANQNRDPGSMLRWDCCAGLWLKMEMAHGGDPEQHAFALEVDDPRAFDLLYEFPHEEIAVLKRPWVGVRRNEDWPVEYRAFVVDGKLAGVSNYYPQMTLPGTGQVMEEVAAVRRAAGAILEAVMAGGKAPWVLWPANIPDQWQRSVQCTMDFIATDDGRVVFLEAGPGFGAGAHPCCFLGQDNRVHPIHGLALGAGNIVEMDG